MVTNSPAPPPITSSTRRMPTQGGVPSLGAPGSGSPSFSRRRGEIQGCSVGEGEGGAGGFEPGGFWDDTFVSPFDCLRPDGAARVGATGGADEAGTIPEGPVGCT
jgi:hypothetical protein